MQPCAEIFSVHVDVTHSTEAPDNSFIVLSADDPIIRIGILKLNIPGKYSFDIVEYRMKSLIAYIFSN